MTKPHERYKTGGAGDLDIPKEKLEKGVAEQPQAGSSLQRNWGAGAGQGRWEDPVAPHAPPHL